MTALARQEENSSDIAWEATVCVFMCVTPDSIHYLLASNSIILFPIFKIIKSSGKRAVLQLNTFGVYI